jgi:DNA-binding CsgD family transcriptional regulator
MTVAQATRHPSMSAADIVAMNALSRLPKRCRDCVLMAAHGYSHKYIADQMNITIHTLRGYLTRGYRDMFGDEIPPEISRNARLAYLVGRYMRELDIDDANREVAA